MGKLCQFDKNILTFKEIWRENLYFSHDVRLQPVNRKHMFLDLNNHSHKTTQKDIIILVISGDGNLHILSNVIFMVRYWNTFYDFDF